MRRAPLSRSVRCERLIKPQRRLLERVCETERETERGSCRVAKKMRCERLIKPQRRLLVRVGETERDNGARRMPSR